MEYRIASFNNVSRWESKPQPGPGFLLMAHVTHWMAGKIAAAFGHELPPESFLSPAHTEMTLTVWQAINKRK